MVLTRNKRRALSELTTADGTPQTTKNGTKEKNGAADHVNGNTEQTPTRLAHRKRPAASAEKIRNCMIEESGEQRRRRKSSKKRRSEPAKRSSHVIDAKAQTESPVVVIKKSKVQKAQKKHLAATADGTDSSLKEDTAAFYVPHAEIDPNNIVRSPRRNMRAANHLLSDQSQAVTTDEVASAEITTPEKRSRSKETEKPRNSSTRKKSSDSITSPLQQQQQQETGREETAENASELFNSDQILESTSNEDDAFRKAILLLAKKRETLELSPETPKSSKRSIGIRSQRETAVPKGTAESPASSSGRRSRKSPKASATKTIPSSPASAQLSRKQSSRVTSTNRVLSEEVVRELEAELSSIASENPSDSDDSSDSESNAARVTKASTQQRRLPSRSPRALKLAATSSMIDSKRPLSRTSIWDSAEPIVPKTASTEAVSLVHPQTMLASPNDTQSQEATESRKLLAGFPIKDNVGQISEQESFRKKRIDFKAKQRQETVNWGKMEVKEITSEMKEDYRVLQLRNWIDPKRFYRRNDMKSMPKTFQVGTIVAGSFEGSKDRLKRKDRKRRFAEEILADTRVKNYTNRVVNEIKATRPVKKKRKSYRGKPDYRTRV